MPKKVPIKPKSAKRRREIDDWVGSGGGESSTSVLEPPQQPVEPQNALHPKPPSQASLATPETPVERDSPQEEQPPKKKGFPPGDMKRMTIDIPKDLHRRIKGTCASRDLKMAEEIRRILEASFPPIY